MGRRTCRRPSPAAQRRRLPSPFRRPPASSGAARRFPPRKGIVLASAEKPVGIDKSPAGEERRAGGLILEEQRRWRAGAQARDERRWRTPESGALDDHGDGGSSEEQVVLLFQRLEREQQSSGVQSLLAEAAAQTPPLARLASPGRRQPSARVTPINGNRVTNSVGEHQAVADGRRLQKWVPQRSLPPLPCVMVMLVVMVGVKVALGFASNSQPYMMIMVVKQWAVLRRVGSRGIHGRGS
ncbi:hypothetical protein CLOM_g13122 [Closterium sp. NIES-68]|nr:hypothetical protein CLOM_g13122 [Closterium sp. NIES-68]